MKPARNLFENIRRGTDHGGGSRVNERKLARPLATKKPMHLVLRSTRATGEWNFLRAKNCAQIDAILTKLARRYGIRVMSFENVGNHLHLIIQSKSRPLLQAFLKALPANIALAITGAKKGNPAGRFFDTVLFSRVVEWGRDLTRLQDYFTKNRLEAVGVDQRILDWWKVFAGQMRT